MLSINPASFFYLCLLRYFDYTRLFPSRVVCLAISSFLNFLIYISFLDLSSLFCRISSRCTNRTQSIHPPPYLVPLLRTSIPTTTLDSDPPISTTLLPLSHPLPPSSTLSLFVLSTRVVQFRTSLSLIYEKLRKTEIN